VLDLANKKIVALCFYKAVFHIFYLQNLVLSLDELNNSGWPLVQASGEASFLFYISLIAIWAINDLEHRLFVRLKLCLFK
jgi:hypothetical protein